MSNGSLICIDFVREEDYQQWLPYWKSYQEFYQVELSEEITKTTWARFFDFNEPVYCAVAKDGDTVLGFVNFVYHRSTWAIKDFCYLEDLFVSENARGQHIGKKLIEFVQQNAKKHSVARLYWHTQESNLRAHRLYDWVATKPGVIEYRMSV